VSSDVHNACFLQLAYGKAEFGATWFHGLVNNPVFDLAVKKGIIEDIRLKPGMPHNAFCKYERQLH
jgi:hypothetical protein